MRLRPWRTTSAILLMLTVFACGGEESPEGRAIPEGGGTVLTIARSKELGSYIADANGRALYLLEMHPRNSSICDDACTEVWPPFLAPQGTPEAGDPAVQAGLIGVMQRRDGSTQVTYNGYPLYYYSGDQGPGQATGQGVVDEWGEWYLVTPQGQSLPR